ncbi:MAG: hypothetical protein A3F31_01430 [Candidatus Levybacteria bacterium RIFCSPHIGHO2_12_FULL_38_12]|nr:MAG: hypothetical protein A3D75_02220 [Candidatus Levybacteria bacterium RIFCSPHIGHO2_02_FULL_37_18]OGH22343.1 MAG: hypothetical protein A3F31_01430 [Candidatus Levybacteria bacterium RIFCSPHIGHO2_12_FULL_38_12]OGH34987.1 MAG: hypothetical protein A3A47_03075 [Candidatus Levybacteria bacterium RIFCSPLOWO2_01_FULL_37_20]OGH43866.1 MAG: hypothetical protein A3J14_02050 [Candidatus Levybacteria bacterium RIFCSPLOWO2_02_FULL_37_18]
MIHVVKATGETEVFSADKLQRSIHRAGVPDSLQNQLLIHIQKRLYDNITTSEIYRHITEFLETSHPFAKSKYNLKQAIMALGPSGYAFEDFVSEILRTQEYQTVVRATLNGNCIAHEIDVVAEKDNKRIMIEAKFHNLSGTKTKIHVILYTKARFDDVKQKNNIHEAWLVTNTKTTTDVIDYALCMNLKVISWSYPEGGSLRDLVEKSGLTPITSSTVLSLNQKQTLLENHIVLCRDISNNPSILDLVVLDEEKRKEVLSEIQFICTKT